MDAEAAETYLRVLAETQLRHFRAPGAQNWDGVRELRYVGVALAALGVLNASVAEAIADELDAMVSLRIRRSGTGPVRAAFGVLPTAAARPAAPPADPPAAWPSMAPAGQVIRLDQDPDAPRLYLLSVTRITEGTQLSFAGRLGPRWTGQGFRQAIGELTAVDDAGFSRTVRHLGDSSDGLLLLAPALPAGARWVEIFRRPDGPRTRVDLTVPPTPVRAVTEPLGPASPAERLLDAIAGDMLAELPGSPHHHVGLDLVVAALEAGGLLPPASAAAGRLAVLCQRAAFQGGQGLVAALTAGRIRPAELPGPWTSVLEHFRDGKRREAGRPGIAPVAAVLPEIDGVRFALSGFNTEAGHTSLRILARGLPSRLALDPPDVLGLRPWFPWWARDSTGQWHVTTDSGRSWHEDLTQITLRMVPPVSPPATSLELITTGRASRMRVTVPLAWRQDA